MQSIDKKQCIETSSCPICGNNSCVIDTVNTINPDCKEKVNLRGCSACHHWWIDPLPKQEYLSRLYANSSLLVIGKGYEEGSKLSKIDMDNLEKYANKILKISSKNEKFNFLEIGVGHGHLFNYFLGKANLCYGVEPGCWKPPHSNIVSDIGNIPNNIKFDVIVIQDVLEHLSNPVTMLTKLRSLANPGCVITSGFPNKDSLLAKLLRGKWRMVRPLGHVHFFSSRSISIAFNNAGWEILLKKDCRMSEISGLDAIKQFDWKLFKNPFNGSYKFIKNLIVGQLIFGKDQWFVQAKAL